MVHVHGARVQRQLEALRRFPLSELVAVAVDTGKSSAIALVADFTGERLCPPVSFDLTRNGLARLSERVAAAIADRPVGVVRLGVEASGYHLPLLAPGMLPSSWELVELNPAHVARQRKANGQVGVKTDITDAAAIFDLLVAGRGSPITRTQVLEQLDAWSTHRRRQVEWHRAVGNHLLSQLHRAFPGADRCVRQLLVTKVGRLVAAEFTDPARLARLGASRFRSFAARRGIRVDRAKAEQFVAAARQAIPAPDAPVARVAVAADLALLGQLEDHIATAETHLALLLPATPFGVLTTAPGWKVVRAGDYGGAVGDPSRWPTARQVYRASGLTPSQHESAGRRIDGEISREGSARLRQSLLQMGRGLRQHDPAAGRYAAQLAARGKHSAVIGCAMANRANRIAFAMVRDQAPYDPGCWR